MYDIPETVCARRGAGGADRRALSDGSCGQFGDARRGRRARRAVGLKLLGVTVLTSFGPEDLEDLGYEGTIASLVERRARKAVDLGVDGIVASPLEAAAVRRIAGPDTVIVTPGVRSAGVDSGRSKARRHTRRRRFATAPTTWSSAARSRAPPTRPPKSTAS